MGGEGNPTPPPSHKTPAQGAATSVLPAASPLPDGVVGRHCEDSQEARIVRGDEEGPRGAATHTLDPVTADRLREYTTAGLRHPAWRRRPRGAVAGGGDGDK
ncbi:NADP-dependent oxidoreductase [Streptomyces sp. NPDC002262]|uniref:NADP-dependent oxidoreductase n=1 Tax=Streptomyces sp. NPDC002262 TaxID=3154414 RepID=UPI0033233610